MSTTKNTYHIDLIFSNLLYGVNFSFFVSLVKHYVYFTDLFFLQVAISALFFTPFALFSRRYRLSWRDFGTISLVTVLIVYGGMFMVLWGARYTNPIDASTIATLGPVFTLVTQSVLLKMKLDITRSIGVILSFVGAGILIFKNGVIVHHGGVGFGNLLVLISVISVAINTVIIKPVLQRLGTPVVMGWYFIIGFVITAPFFMKSAFQINYLELPYFQICELLYILILGTVLPSYLLYRGTEKLTAVHTALYRYIQPVVATALAVLRGQEELTRSNLIVAAIIFSGVVLVVAAYESIWAKFKNFVHRFAHN